MSSGRHSALRRSGAAPVRRIMTDHNDAHPVDPRVREPLPATRWCVASWSRRSGWPGTIPYTRRRSHRRDRRLPWWSWDPIVELRQRSGHTGRGRTRIHHRPAHVRPVVNEPTGETFAVGIVADSIGCAAVGGGCRHFEVACWTSTRCGPLQVGCGHGCWSRQAAGGVRGVGLGNGAGSSTTSVICHSMASTSSPRRCDVSRSIRRFRSRN